jgi:hypothetical protein
MENFGGPEIQVFKGDTIGVYDNPHGLEIYAEGSHNLFAAGPNVTISFYAPRSDPGGKLYRTVVARITMPAQGAHGMAVALFDFLNKSGLNPEAKARPQ